MKTILRLSLLALLFIGFASTNSIAQTFKQKVERQIDSVNVARAKLSKDEQKIEPQIYKMLTDYESAVASGKSKAEAAGPFHKSSIMIDNEDRIYMTITLLPIDQTEATSVEAAIKASGGVIHSSHTGTIYSWIPIDAIRTIAALPSVTMIEQSHPGKTRVIISAGDAQLQANTARTTYGVDGTGVKVGVISNGIENVTQVENAGELPSVFVPVAGTAGGTTPVDNEGTAMLEIIHDLAPGAQLYFEGIGPNDRFGDFVDRIDALSNVGCKIIVDDFGFPYEEPFFSDQCDAGTAINKFITQDGGTYVSAAGNDAQDVYGGFTDFSGSLNKFLSGNTYLQVTLPANTSGAVVLQWKDSWLSPQYDYDISVYDLNENLVSTGGNNVQGSGVPPREIAYFSNGTGSTQTYDIEVSAKNIGSEINNEEFKIFCDGGTIINGTTTNQIYGHPAYPGVISVAAYHADAQTTIASYSSHGPATIYSTAQQRWLVAQNVPTITATSKVETYVGSTGLWQDPIGTNADPFEGTSAAAPHVAALAALFFDYPHGFPSLTNQDFYDDLTASGTAVGTNTGNHQWTADAGFGKANALYTLNQAAGSVATPVFNPGSGTYSAPSQSISISCATSGASIYYTNNGTDPTQSSTLYTSSITVSSNTTLKAKAYKGGMNPSSIASAIYVISDAPAPSVSPQSGEYPAPLWGVIAWQPGLWLFSDDGNPDPNHPHGYPQSNSGTWNPVWRLTGTKTYTFWTQNPNNGDWSPAVPVTYTLDPGVEVHQVDESGSTIFDSQIPWSRWETNHWQPYPPDAGLARPSSQTTWYLLGNRNWKPNTFQKYYEWIDPLTTSVPNYAQMSVDQNTGEIKGKFQTAVDATIQSQLLETSELGGHLYLYDPWWPDQTDQTYGLKNRGASSIPHEVDYSTNVLYNIGTGAANMGVFESISGPPSWTLPYYSVSAPSMQPIGSHNGSFLNWSASPLGSVTFQNSSANPTGVEFNNANTTITANYKGHLLTTTQSATGLGNQRKIARDAFGTLHMVYTSMDKVWYTSSTDNGTTWSNEQQVSGSNAASNPSIATDDNGDVYVVWEEVNGSGGTRYINGNQCSAVALDSDPIDMEPSVAASDNGAVLVSYRKTYSGDTYKLYYQYSSDGSSFTGDALKVGGSGYPYIFSFPSVAWNSQSGKFMVSAGPQPGNFDFELFGFDGTNWSDVGSVYYSTSSPQTSSYSQIAVDGTGRTHGTWIAYDNYYGDNSSSIMHRSYLNGNWSTISVFREQDIPEVYTSVCGHSDACGASLFFCGNPPDYLYNVYSTDGSSWNGQINISPSAPLSYPISIEKAPSSSVTFAAVKGSSLPYGIVNQTKDNSQAGYYNGILKVQAGNESNDKKSGNVDIYRRIELIDTTTGGLLAVQFGKISGPGNSNGDNAAMFPKINTDSLNKSAPSPVNAISTFMNTSSLNLKQNDSLSVDFGVRSKGWKRGGNIVFELVDSLSKKTIKQIGKYSFSLCDTGSSPANPNGAGGISDFQEMDNQIVNKLQNLKGTLRVDIDSVDYDSLVVNYMDVMVFNGGDGSGKNTPKSILQIGNVPKEFQLSQNYPNPFNPSTIINYQLPKDGHVTLKVYDILGREVKTLVDQDRSAGYYQTMLDGTQLASGVYFYRINIHDTDGHDFISIRKALLMK